MLSTQQVLNSVGCKTGTLAVTIGDDNCPIVGGVIGQSEDCDNAIKTAMYHAVPFSLWQWMPDCGEWVQDHRGEQQVAKRFGLISFA